MALRPSPWGGCSGTAPSLPHRPCVAIVGLRLLGTKTRSAAPPLTRGAPSPTCLSLHPRRWPPSNVRDGGEEGSQALRGVRKLPTCGHALLAEAGQGQTTAPRGSHAGDAVGFKQHVAAQGRGGPAQAGPGVGRNWKLQGRVCAGPLRRPPTRACVPQLCARRSLSLGLLLATRRPQEKKWPR